MAEQRETVGLAIGTRGQLVGPSIIGGVSETPPIDPPTLAAAGIDKNLAKRARAAAAIPAAEFAAIVAEGRTRIADAADLVKRRLQNAGSRAVAKAAPLIN